MHLRRALTAAALTSAAVLANLTGTATAATPPSTEVAAAAARCNWDPDEYGWGNAHARVITPGWIRSGPYAECSGVKYPGLYVFTCYADNDFGNRWYYSRELQGWVYTASVKFDLGSPPPTQRC
ncbi:hypothetical protein [Streptomyces sp. Rer75]|uniref:hypothetical protein n=1 Tax=unclassified Streptomyces TaxID=2593676 RepID=UPI0015D0910F|nr:hypothetical protein [Streptomyces sp. Rer75]QLH21383.1 hypothetical protein HYQ63_12720 [Streptomyces sp. Rer75]